MFDGALGEFLDSTVARAVLWAAVLAVVCACGFYLVGKLRNQVHETGDAAGGMLTNIRELHGEGELSDDEYRTIKAMLAQRLQNEAKNKEGKT
jgi:uncharacterized membrane protein